MEWEKKEESRGDTHYYLIRDIQLDGWNTID